MLSIHVAICLQMFVVLSMKHSFVLSFHVIKQLSSAFGELHSLTVAFPGCHHIYIFENKGVKKKCF